MGNPNNCATCDYTKLNANREGHCYMFRNAPTDACMQHTLRDKPLRAFGEALADAMADMPELRDELVRAGLVVPNAEVNGGAAAELKKETERWVITKKRKTQQ